MSVERFIAQNFESWQSAAKKIGKSYYSEADRRDYARQLAVGCFYSEKDILEGLEWYTITEDTKSEE